MTGKTSVKASIRSAIRARLNLLSTSQKEAESTAIRNQLQFQKGSHVALFAGSSKEPQLLQFISENPEIVCYLPRVLGPGAMAFFPVTHPVSLKKGAFGILEPTGDNPATALDIILCPGLAFTTSGSRLGQGGGFYDRALTHFPGALRIGVAFSSQILPELPSEPHDLDMNFIVTGHPEP